MWPRTCYPNSLNPNFFIVKKMIRSASRGCCEDSVPCLEVHGTVPSELLAAVCRFQRVHVGGDGQKSQALTSFFVLVDFII